MIDDDDDVFITRSTASIAGAAPHPPGGTASRPGAGPTTPPACPTRSDRKVMTVVGIALIMLGTVATAIALANRPHAAPPPTRTSASTGSSLLSETTTSEATPHAPASRPVWPSTAGGRPAALGQQDATPSDVDPGAAPGVYVWNDFEGWHVWVVNGGDTAGLTGALVSDDEFARAETATPGEGSIKITNNVVEFDLPADVPIAGINVNPGFFSASLRFKLSGPDGDYPAPSVFTGGVPTPVPSLPLIIQKAPS